jgi:ABC-type multidrug transport system fused ATPase/permease subunit
MSFIVLKPIYFVAEKIARSVQATHAIHEFSTLSLLTEESKGSSYPSLSGSISFSDVQFNYPSRPLKTPILKSISLNIAQGECVALVGTSGSGKSTIAALLQRLYEPIKGVVKIGGKDVNGVDVGWLREHIGVVSQQPNLFDASIADNVELLLILVPTTTPSRIRIFGKLRKRLTYIRSSWVYHKVTTRELGRMHL